jgi:hypothetical protein
MGILRHLIEKGGVKHSFTSSKLGPELFKPKYSFAHSRYETGALKLARNLKYRSVKMSAALDGCAVEIADRIHD